MKYLPVLGASVLLAVLAGCGGGGSPGAVSGGAGGAGNGNPGQPVPPVNPLVPTIANSENFCQAPRGAGFPDQQGTLTHELNWVRAWIDTTYLWYQDVPTFYKQEDYKTPVDYFAVLKSYGTTASGKPKDQFHFTYPTDVWEASQQGVDFGYGMEWASNGVSAPRNWIVTLVEPNSPAGQAGVRRGDRIVSVDGADLVHGSDSATVAVLNAGLFPAKAGESHNFGLNRHGVPVSVRLNAADVPVTPVQNVRTIDTPTGKVGYLTFNSHNNVSELQLIEAVQNLKTAGIGDLVLDLRYNGGGLLSVANQLAYMIAGPQASAGRVFERLTFNDKTAPQAPILFSSTAAGLAAPRPANKGQALPYLGLKRVTVLTTPGTCSASESVINGLRGIDIEVNLIGGGTCGKPYGFYPAPNCGTTYFAVQFQGVNAKGYGDYADGMTPTCSVADDYSHALGDPAEGLLAAALQYRNNKMCPTAGSATKLLASVSQSAGPQAMRPMRPWYKDIAIYPATR
ncbi:S41 family peptidase [Janthinobacterium agaricidamnosum]|uniref:Peptidase S41 family protein n=1 Tax=Janthinobacterium agaricidamnosum NBRC 102515 = DSM 9628 TaxID=1349767 RepID=W0VCI6_9BURK|nr:S41 family peptidase [Janthinobacterium agaricidamnosum]CDG85621.1 peptidase S41 family protein [Janthinobacterium agaricidamnosum NBRC 102515 = DSM 9628]